LSEGGEEEGEFVAPRPNATGEKKSTLKAVAVKSGGKKCPK
jgi:hypothetical protein